MPISYTWISTYKYKVLVEGVKEYVLLKVKELRKHYPEVEYIEINVQADHVHMVVSFPAKYSIGKIVQIIKTNTSKGMFEKFKFLKERYRTRHIILSHSS